jgi:hypothetical protein
LKGIRDILKAIKEVESGMFRVKTKGFDQEYDRWTDALDQANRLIPGCKGLFGEIRILEKGELIWTYTRSHKYPMYIGAGVYDRLARRFILENTVDPDELPTDNA